MACRIIIKGIEQDSKLHEELINISKNNEEAEAAYAAIFTPVFKEFYGDWQADGFDANYLNEQGEPLLQPDAYWYSPKGDILAVGKHKFSDFSVAELKEVTQQLAYQVVKNNNLTDFETIGEGETKISVSKDINDYIRAKALMAKKAKDRKLWNKITTVSQNSDDLKENVIAYINSKGLKLRQINEELNETQEDQDTKTDLGIKDYLTVNSKDSASANIELLLSFVPKIEGINEDGSTKYAIGAYLNAASFYEFDEIWNTLQPALSDIVTTNTVDGKVSDLYELMNNKIGDLAATRPSIRYLQAQMNKLPEYKKTEFVQAFAKTKYSYTVTLVSGKAGEYVFKIKNAQNFSPSNIVSDSWNAQFEDSLAFNRIDSSFNPAVIKTLLAKVQDKIVKPIETGRVKFISFNGNTIKQLREVFTDLGMTPSTEAFKEYLKVNGDETISAGDFKNITDNLEAGLTRLSEKETKDFFDNKGNLMPEMPNTLRNVIVPLSTAQGKYEPGLTEATVMGKGGNQYNEYSKPSIIHGLINRIKQGDYSQLDEMLSRPHNKNSAWLNHLDHLRKTGDVEGLKKIKINTFLQFKEEGKNDQGDDPSTIPMIDMLSDSINKTLNFRKAKGHDSIVNTMTAADKSTHHQTSGMPYLETESSGTYNNFEIYNTETVELFTGYVKDELARWADEMDAIDEMKEGEKVLYYHTDKNGETRVDGKLVGNAFKIHTFPGLIEAIGANQLLDKSGRPVTDSKGVPLLPDNLVEAYIEKVLKKQIEDTYRGMQEYGVIRNDGTNNSIDKDILATYSEEVDPVLSAIADYTATALMANIEGSKMYSGDIAYYKNIPDFLKRVPGVYANGLVLRLGVKNEKGELIEDNDHQFTVAVLDNVDIASTYLEQITSSFKDKKLAIAYAKVNTTDAQGYITPKRWKFLIERSKGWSPKLEKLYKKATTKINGEWQILDSSEFKQLSAQPLKGVYFGQQGGMPTYLKYSQAVLWPGLIAGSALEGLAAKMGTSIDEAVVVDGIKVGLVKPSKVHNEKGELDLSKTGEFNTIQLDNRNWRLQQDLPNSGLHQTLLGSQIQRNIVANIDMTADYGGMSGAQIVDAINEIFGDLSQRGVEEVAKEFDIQEDGSIDKKVLDRIILDELKSKEGSDNLINAIQAGAEYDTLFSYRDKIQNILFAYINKRTVDIKTNGGSFIQMASFGITQKTANQIGVTWLKEPGSLSPPLIVDGKVQAGQVLMPHTMIAKILPEYRNMTIKQINEAIDPDALKIIGYRIPNQAMSSNDALDIVGILPPEMGDTIIAYNEITAKTGSDYDIDKMYVMVPHIKVVNGKITSVKYNKSKSPAENDKKAVENRMLDLYNMILKDPKTYDSLMTSIDGSFLKDYIAGNKEKGIEALFPEKGYGDLDLFSPFRQLELKAELMGGTFGIGQTANHQSDHPLTQMADAKLNQYLGMGNVDEFNNTTFSNIRDENNNYDITTIIGAFFNAYVDIAKDSYIVRGNHNTYTANVVFMLLRAGIDYKWVNAFIGQPSLKELVSKVNNTEGRMSERVLTTDQKRTKKPIEIVREKYTIEGEELSSYQDIVPNIKKMLPLDTLEQMIKDPSKVDPQLQQNILTIFEKWQDISKSFTSSVLSSKLPSNYDIIGKIANENRLTKVIDDGVIINFTDKFKKNGVNTSLGHAHDNSLGLVNIIAEKLFIANTPGFTRILNEFSTELGKGILSDRDLGKTLEKEIFAYLYSQTDLNVDADNIKEMFRGNNSTATKLNNFQKHAIYGENPFIKNLSISKGDKKNGYDFIGMPNTKGQPKYFKDQMYAGWLEILQNPETRNFADELIRYSYYSSGFKRGISTIFEHVPHQWLFSHGVNKEMATWKNVLQDEGIYEDLKDQVYRHKWNDSSIVPTVHKYASRQLPANIPNANKFSIANMFAIMDSVGNYKSESGHWKRFVTRDFTDKRTDVKKTTLFKFQGTVKNEAGVEHGVYTKTYKLGHSSKGKNIVEYGTNKKKSVLSENNISAELMINHKKMLKFVQNIVTMPSININTENVVEPFKLDYQALNKKAKETKKKC